MPTASKTKIKPQAKAKGQTVTSEFKLDSKDPIPFEYGGLAFSYVNRQRYLPFLANKDDFFKTLLEAKTLSPTQTACVETKKDYCAGRGLVDKNGKPFSKEFEAYLKRVNAKNESAFTINRKAFGSHFTFGNTPIEIVRFTIAGKRFVYVYVHNVLEWRLTWPDPLTGIVSSAIHSKLFLKSKFMLTDLLKDSRTLPLYDISQPDSKKNWWKNPLDGSERTLIWLKNDYEGYDHYGMPQSVASLMQQVLEYKGARYNLDNFENNMVIGGVLALKGSLSQDEANKIGRKVVTTHTGDGKQGRVMVVASEEGISGSEYHEFNTTKEGSFIQLDDKIVQKIIMSNQWDPILAGIAPAHSMGKGNTFLRTIYDIKKQTVITPMQEFLIENLWVPLQYIIRKYTGIDADKYELAIKNIDPISIIADVDPTPAIKVKEVRTALDLPVDEKDPVGEMYLGQLKANQQSQGSNTDGGGGENVPA